MGMDRVPASARALPAEPWGTEAGLTLAALIDVLDRADEVLVRTPPRPRRAALHRPAASRTVADRWDPLRDLDVRPASTARLPGSTSRAAVPSSGTDRPAPRVVPARAVPLRPVPPAPPARQPVVPAPSSTAPAAAAPSRTPLRARLLAALAAIVRRAASWGAGPDGAHLAWNAPPPARVYRATRAAPLPAAPPSAAPRSAARSVDPPVVLREMPSTPTSPPVARAVQAPVQTPVHAPVPASRVHPGPAVRRTPVRPLRTPALSTVRRIPPLPPARAAVPSRARSPGGVRGSPGSGPARGSPPWWPEPG